MLSWHFIGSHWKEGWLLHGLCSVRPRRPGVCGRELAGGRVHAVSAFVCFQISVHIEWSRSEIFLLLQCLPLVLQCIFSHSPSRQWCAEGQPYSEALPSVFLNRLELFLGCLGDTSWCLSLLPWVFGPCAVWVLCTSYTRLCGLIHLQICFFTFVLDSTSRELACQICFQGDKPWWGPTCPVGHAHGVWEHQCSLQPRLGLTS